MTVGGKILFLNKNKNQVLLAAHQILIIKKVIPGEKEFKTAKRNPEM